jgi:hypothetical protein
MMENRLENQRQVASKPTQPPKGERSGHGVGVIKFALVVAMVVEFCGRTVEGGESSEVTESWTFMRAWRQLAALGHPADLMFDTIRPLREFFVRRSLAGGS